ncbi:MAG TPA: helicase-related protein, partial [Candidatus Margulisiibacteriota bacterium]|nr:helicase-related protein [Candidatus Margulisiibacteriota bacterium]
MAAITALKRIEAGDGSVSLADQKVLAKYVGWGGIPQIFDEKNAKFAQQRADLKTALTSAEYAAARASTINAHYTSPDVVRGMWQAMRDLGYPGGVTLEPGMGVGNFLGMAPEDLPNKFTGVEMDHITGRIARALYPEARVLIKPFEETPIPRGVFDGVIGNVPFANVKPNDKEYNPGRALSLHNYFIHKAAHLMKPGGVMGLVTTHYTLDAVNTKERQLLHKAGLDLLGAVRLPDTAFKANAGTEVTTDILFFRKRMPGEEPGNDRWLKTENVDLDGKPTPINAYFLDHPQAVLGEHSSRGTMYAKDSYTVAGSAENLRQRIEDAVRNIIKPEAEAAGRLFAADPNNTVEGAIDDIALPPAEVKDNAYYLKDGVIKQRIGPAETTPTMPASHQPIIKSFIGLRDAAREVLARQREEWDGQGKAPWADAQKKLNSLYDAFVKAHGPINKVQITRRTDADGEVQEYRRYPNLAKFKDDPDVFLVSALERADEEKDTFTKSALMSERVLEPTKEITHVETPQEALIASMNMRGGVDLPYMAKILGAESPEDVSKNLAGRIFKDPQTGQWHIAEKYLSGNVRAKLALAEQFAKSDAAYKANIDALKAVQPPDLKPSEINVRLGVGWIPPQDYADFAAFLLKSPANIAHIPSEAMWRVELADPYSVANRNEWGVHGASFSRLFEDALNQRSTTVTFRDDEGKTHTDVQKTVVAQEKQRAIQDEFERWVWADADRAKRLSDKYNWEVNNLAIPTYNGDHLTLPGSSSTIELRSTQKKAVWRYLVSGNTLLDHVVGAGKTFTSIAAGMEAKRLGLLKKPTYVVPNHMLEQFSREFMQLYPGAHLIVADKDNFAGDVRRRFVARVAAENWDAIIMPHSGFEKVPMSPEYQVRFLQREVQEYEGLIRSSKGDDVTVKELEKAKARRLAKIKDLMQAKDKDKGISFEEMGSDGVFLDEAHLFKNLEFATKSRGMQAASSQRAFDMFMKARYIDEMSPGRGLMFMTGTPISNSMAEMYTMQRYLGHPALADRGLTHFDAWAAAFGDMVTQAEITPDGASARLKTRFARFRNIPELVALYRQFADLVTTQDLLNTGQIKLPKMIGDKVQTHEIEGSDALKGYVSELAQRAEQVRNREVKPEEDNMLKISGDGRKAALDLRLVDPTSEAEPDRKAIAVADRVSDIWKKTKARKGTQLVFLDLSTPNSEGRFNVYDDIRAALLKRGIPRDEIAFVHDADNDQKKAKLFESVREGRVRVLFGSTDKMGVGTNVQKRLYALHHVDAPWRPADLEQREGRIIRQGNENPEVEVHRYITTGSFDAYMWQTLERKARFINQVKNGDPNVRNAEDIDEQALSYAEVKALASGNPLILDKARADADVDRLSRLRRAHSDNQRTMQWEVKGMPERNQADENVAAGYEKDAKAVKFQAEDKYEATIGKKKFNKRADAMNALAKAITDAHIAAQKEPSENGHEYPGGEYAGIKFNIHTDGKHDPTLLAELPSKVRGVEVNLSAANGALARLENYLRKLPELANEARERVAARRDREKDLRAQLNRKFEKEEQYQAAIKRQKEIDEKLGLTEKAQPESAVADTDEEGNVTGKGNIHGMADLFNR